MTNVALDDVDRHIAPLNCKLLRTITIAPEDTVRFRPQSPAVHMWSCFRTAPLQRSGFVLSLVIFITKALSCSKESGRVTISPEALTVLAEGIARILISAEEPVG
jgi:hypothetical protein